MQKLVTSTAVAALFGAMSLGPSPASAAEPGGPGCDTIAAALGGAVHPTLSAAVSSVAPNQPTNGGLGTHMWGTIVDRDGKVCAVAFTGITSGDQWPGSRVISAQKANTANAFSLPGLALSTANLWAATQPGGSLFGLQFSNPVNPAVAYGDNSVGTDGADSTAAPAYGMPGDPLEGLYVGGVNVFGGGLALYDGGGTLVGAVGVSGDTSCADHNISWRTRDALGLDYIPGGVSATGDDNIVYDLQSTNPGKTKSGFDSLVSAGGFGHPSCGFGADTANPAILAACPVGDGATPGC